MKVSALNQPDGGYGWVIVFASALTNFLTLSLIQCFGLILKDTFAQNGLSATEGSLIINLNVAFGMITGPVTGVLHKKLGCRKTAVLAGFLLAAGMVCTSFSNTFVTLFVSYGILTSLGAQMSEATVRLSINLYFKKKRSLVTGFVMTVAGFGPILIPQLFGFLRKIYSTEEVTLLYGGLCANVLVAAALLQPVEWHVKQKGSKEEKMEMTEIKTRKRGNKHFCRRIFDNVTTTFDLDLLKDPIFDNIVLGLALASFAELNFTLLIPYILKDYELTTSEIAIFLSTLGVSDMLSRFMSPYVGNYFSKPSRLMCVYSLIILMMIKFTIILTQNFYILLVIGFVLGMAKGIRKVYMWLVIPDYVSLEKLPSASGMDMMARGICILVGGPILGVLRDSTGSYVICIIVMNCVTIATMLMWGTEAAILKYKRLKMSRVND